MGSLSSAVDRAPSPWTVRELARRLRGGDAIAHTITLIFAASIILITSLLVCQLWIHSVASRRAFGWHFWATSVWDPVFDHFGALPFIYGTVITSAVSLALALPLGLAAAIFLSELAPRSVSDSISFLIDLLAAVPSVIYGLLGDRKSTRLNSSHH